MGVDDVTLADLDGRSFPPGKTALRARTATMDDRPVGCDVVVVRGATPGPVLLVVGSVHGDEYEGPTAIAEWAAELEHRDLTGTVVAIPAVNEPAFYATSRSGPDGLNLARVFPGDPAGSVTEQIAASLTALIQRADAFVDLHAAGTYYTLKPWAGYGLHPDPAVLAVQRKMAFAFPVEFVWGTHLKPGRSLSAAADCDVPAIYVEMTGSGLCRREDVEADLAGLRGVLRCLGMAGDPLDPAPPRWLRESGQADEGHLQIDHPAPRQGVFHPTVSIWDEVAQGEMLGVLACPGGGEPLTIRANRAGRVAVLRTAPPVREGDFLAVVVPV